MIHRSDYRAPDFLLDQTSLEVDIGALTQVRARLQIRRAPTADPAAALVLNGRELELVSLLLDGQVLDPSRYSRGDETLRVEGVPDAFELEVVTRIDPERNTALEGWYRSGPMLCTQCEPQGFSRITYSLDRPDVLSRYRVRLEADKSRYPVLLANGDCVDRGDCGDHRHYTVWEDPHPKPSYLFAMVAGRLSRVEAAHVTASGRQVALHFYVDPGNEERAGHAIHSLQKAMCWDEAVYGLEYDLDTYMVVAARDFNMGAMENKGLNLFNARYVLASPSTATDDDYDGIESVIAHEYFHNWTGNRVTCRDWFQLSLKEGLTVFRDQCFSADQGSAEVTRIRQVAMLRTLQFPEDAGPMAHPVRPDSYVEVNNLYTATVYEKGAEILRMIHTLVGAETFVRGVRRYLADHDGGAATVEDLLSALETESGQALDGFRRWYSQSGTPRLSVEDHFDATAQRYQLQLKQHTPPNGGQTEKAPLPIPIRFSARSVEGAAMALSSTHPAMLSPDMILFDQAQLDLVFEGVEQRPVPALLHGFSAPVEIDHPRPAPELAMLLLNEPDGFLRWEAVQRLFRDALAELMAGEGGPVLDTLLRALQALSAQPPEDKALLAELLRLPTAPACAAMFNPLDPLALAAARSELQLRMARALTGPFSVWVQWAPEELGAEDRGRRSLGGIALSHLCRLGIGQMLDLAQQRAQCANMTVAMSALQALRDIECPQREQAMAGFRHRFKADALVMDKWFALEAAAALASPVARIQALLDDPDFQPNPNRVRAVLGTFAQHQLCGFHAADGSGYALYADQVTRLDGSNPQLAARLTDALIGFGPLAEPYRGQMVSHLRALSEQVRSQDVREKVDRALAQV